ncbi:MAG: hypothetical protein VR64_20490 [Desulfatitalea sp. BRH_c12]|nr:MAG: hypothetical protein VR64_20490 [Desulfatitalea sp. BRH_c12]
MSWRLSDFDNPEFLTFPAYAWHFDCYSKYENLAQAESEARGKKAGLWRNPNVITAVEISAIG